MPKNAASKRSTSVEKAAAARVHLARRRRDRGRRTSSTSQRSGGTSRDGVDAVAQQLPERLRAVGAAGKAASHADDRDRLAAARARPLEPGLAARAASSSARLTGDSSGGRLVHRHVSFALRSALSSSVEQLRSASASLVGRAARSSSDLRRGRPRGAGARRRVAGGRAAARPAPGIGQRRDGRIVEGERRRQRPCRRRVCRRLRSSIAISESRPSVAERPWCSRARIAAGRPSTRDRVACDVRPSAAAIRSAGGASRQPLAQRRLLRPTASVATAARPVSQRVGEQRRAGRARPELDRSGATRSA